tara:strand:+ start:489 stop:671 length:183 start_codon:yes stop_codon:yes gene_type:complete
MARKNFAHLQKTPTKGWESATIRLPKKLMENIRKDAFDKMRPIGLHISYVIKEYLKKGDK